MIEVISCPPLIIHLSIITYGVNYKSGISDYDVSFTLGKRIYVSAVPGPFLGYSFMLREFRPV